MNKSEVARHMRYGGKGKTLSPETQFKKGDSPSNKLPVGTKTIRIDKKGKERTWIKIDEPNVWQLYAVHIWLSEGGTIPKGFVLHHLDSDSLNDDISNLCVVSRAAHIKLHRGDLDENKPSITHVKDKSCPDCGLEYRGRGKSIARCEDCARESAREAKRRYKERNKGK